MDKTKEKEKQSENAVTQEKIAQAENVKPASTRRVIVPKDADKPIKQTMVNIFKKPGDEQASAQCSQVPVETPAPETAETMPAGVPSGVIAQSLPTEKTEEIVETMPAHVPSGEKTEETAAETIPADVPSCEIAQLPPSEKTEEVMPADGRSCVTEQPPHVSDMDIQTEVPQPVTPLSVAIEREMDRIPDEGGCKEGLDDDSDRMMSVLEEAVGLLPWRSYSKDMCRLESGDYDPDLVEFYANITPNSLGDIDDPEAELESFLSWMNEKGHQHGPRGTAYVKEINAAIPNHERLQEFLGTSWQMSRRFCSLLHHVQNDVAMFESWLIQNAVKGQNVDGTNIGDESNDKADGKNKDKDEEEDIDKEESEEELTQYDEFGCYRFPRPPSQEHPDINRILDSAAEAFPFLVFWFMAPDQKLLK